MKAKFNFIVETLPTILVFTIMEFESCTKAPPPPPNATQVLIEDASFAPYNVTIAGGTPVTWINKSTLVQTVTADDGSFNSWDIVPGGAYSHTFSRGADLITYHSTAQAGMTGTVTVVVQQ